jgi:signal peptidase II
MKTKSFLRIIVILFILGINIGCDQVSKSLVRSKMTEYSEVSFLHDHVHLFKVENKGAFLSFGDSLSSPMKWVFLNLLPLAVVIFGLIFILSKPTLNRFMVLGLIMVVGGGIGNLYDRIIHGSVTDFMHINFGLFQTGIFNVADVSIMIGLLIILIQAVSKKPDLEESKI